MRSAARASRRYRKGDDPEHPHAEDLRRKDFGLRQSLTDVTMVGHDLLGTLDAGFKSAVPLLKFLMTAVGQTAF